MTPRERAVQIANQAIAKSDSFCWDVIAHWVERALVAEEKIARTRRVDVHTYAEAKQ